MATSTGLLCMLINHIHLLMLEGFIQVCTLSLHYCPEHVDHQSRIHTLQCKIMDNGAREWLDKPSNGTWCFASRCDHRRGQKIGQSCAESTRNEPPIVVELQDSSQTTFDCRSMILCRGIFDRKVLQLSRERFVIEIPQVHPSLRRKTKIYAEDGSLHTLQKVVYKGAWRANNHFSGPDCCLLSSEYYASHWGYLWRRHLQRWCSRSWHCLWKGCLHRSREAMPGIPRLWSSCIASSEINRNGGLVFQVSMEHKKDGPRLTCPSPCLLEKFCSSKRTIWELQSWRQWWAHNELLW